MRVGYCQSDLIFGEVKRNLDAASAGLAKVSCDLMVLPELFATGYQFVSKEEVESLAEAVPDGPTTQRLLEIARDRRRFRLGAVGDRETHLSAVPGEQPAQGEGDRARRAAAAEHERPNLGAVGQQRTDRGREPGRVGIVRKNPSALETQHIGGADASGAFARRIGEPQRILFVRQRDIDAREPGGGEPLERARKRLRPRLDEERQIDGVGALALRPAAVDERRQRMADRPADDAGAAERRSRRQNARTPASRRKPRSGRSERPRTAK